VAVLRRVLRSQQAGLLLLIVALTVALTLAAGSRVDEATGRTINNFFNSYTLIQTATDASFIAIMAVGATLVIISGGIDLSVG
jgi:ribose transport system permease protein